MLAPRSAKISQPDLPFDAAGLIFSRARTPTRSQLPPAAQSSAVSTKPAHCKWHRRQVGAPATVNFAISARFSVALVVENVMRATAGPAQSDCRWPPLLRTKPCPNTSPRGPSCTEMPVHRPRLPGI